MPTIDPESIWRSRRVIPYNFTGDTGQSIATALRCVVGDTVLSCPDQFPDVLLGSCSS